MLLNERIEEIKKFFNGDIEIENKIIDEYSRDTSLFKVVPDAVLFPKTVDDIKNLVKFVSDKKSKGENVSLTARSAGTDMTGGPLSGSLIINFTKYFNRIKEIGDNYAISEPGVYYRDFEKETLAKNLLFPSYPASRELCAIGGIVSNNSGGEKTLTYGKTEDYIEEIKIVLSDGNEYIFKPLNLKELEEKMNGNDFETEIYRKMYKLLDENYSEIKKAKPIVSKNSAGYYLWNVFDKERRIFDLTKLIVGAQGTLGIVTEAKFRLIKPKKHSRLLVMFLNDIEHKEFALLINKVLDYKPESFESYDDKTFKIAMKLFPMIVKRLSGGIIKLGLSFIPEFLMVLTGGVPKMVLIAEFTGDSEEEALAKAINAQKGIANFKIKSRLTKTKAEADKYWAFRRESFNLLRQKMKKLRTAPFIDDISVRPEFLPEFLPKLNEVLGRYKVIYTIAGHIGDGNFHIIPLMDFSKPGSIQIIKNLAEEVYGLVIKFRGSITGEHNDGIIRTPYLKMMYGENICHLFEEVKDIFDPNRIFNPGKKVFGTKEYAFSHVDGQAK